MAGKRLMAVSFAVLVLASACGQKPGVYGGGTALIGQPEVAEGGPSVGGSHEPDGASSDVGFDAGEDGGDVADVGQSTAEQQSSDREPAEQPPREASSSGSDRRGARPSASEGLTPRGSDRTGLSDDRLTIALHAPITGAAPLPSTTFEKSRDLYWRHLEARGQSVAGRERVELLFRDDKYDPSSAVQVCRELASKAFFLFGAGGTDQIQACGRYANHAKVPYVSVGVTEAGLGGLPFYFALSMTYRQQGPLLAQLVSQRFGGQKVAAVVTDTPNFDDAVRGWEQGVQRQGLDYYRTLRPPKGDTSWYTAFAADLKDAGVDVVYINTSPVDYIRFAQQAHQQGYRPQFVGVGITMGLNAVLNAACPETDGGIFFSPFPGLDWARQNVPEFFQTGRDRNAPTDDIAFGLWAIAKQQHGLLQRYEEVFGNDLTREDFRAVVEQQRGVETGIFPRLSYSPDNHFGADQVHVLQGDCDAGEYRTSATFSSSF